MVAPIAVPETMHEGVLYALQEGFQNQLRRPLAGFALYAGHETRFGDWGNEEIRTDRIGEMDHVVISMDIPPVQGDSMAPPVRTAVEVPIFTKDLVMGGRKWRQIQLTGLDPQITRAQSWAMAKEIERFLMLGTPTGKPGPKFGLLNIPGMTTTSGGNWNDPKILNRNLGDATGKVLDRGHSGRFTLLVNALDLGVFNEFIGDNSIRIGDNLPGTIGRILTSAHVSTGEAFLINEDTDNYEVIAPLDDPSNGLSFGLGNVTVGLGPGDNPPDVVGTRQEQMDNLMKTRVVRFLNILTTRMNRVDDEAFVERLTYSRS